jgi:hypothetical protein
MEQVEIRFVPLFRILLVWLIGGILSFLLVGVGLGEASRVRHRLRRFRASR